MCDKTQPLWWTRPCPCNGGWGPHKTLADLLDTIEDEIRLSGSRQRWQLDAGDEWLAGQAGDLADEGLSLDEIAVSLGMRVGEVRSLLRRAGYRR